MPSYVTFGVYSDVVVADKSSCFCRRCPGNHLIEQSFWIVMTTILATLDISKAKDENGNVLEPNVVYENSVFRYVAFSHFCSFVVSYGILRCRLVSTSDCHGFITVLLVQESCLIVFFFFTFFCVAAGNPCLFDRSPSTFQCDLRPRTEQALKIMRQTADAH